MDPTEAPTDGRCAPDGAAALGSDLAAFCHSVLTQGELAAKLAPPRAARGGPLPDPSPDRRADALPTPPPRPARAPGLTMAPGAPRLPRPRALGDAAARAACLARFAHHELQTVELFAWALLRWPALPPRLRRGWVGVLEDEQRHCRLYLARVADHGARFEDFHHSDYFWKQLPAIEAAPDGPRAFLAAVGLTLEQANLDFSGLYAEGFRAAGDEASARVCERVHEDEIGHVRLAYDWLRTLDPDAPDGAVAYRRAVPFPLSAARAKGRRFDDDARRRAGLDRALIEHVRGARSTQETAAAPPRGSRPSDP